MKTARHPYVTIRCPHTHESIFVKEVKTDTGWTWLYRGRHYDTLDDVLDARGKKINKQIDYGQ